MGSPTTTAGILGAVGGLLCACVAPSSSGPWRGRTGRFSPSAALKVLFLDFHAPEFPEPDVSRAGDLFLDSLVGARQAEIVNARDLPELRDESTRTAFEGDRSPRLLGGHARELGADVLITGDVFRAGRNLVFTIDAIDPEGRLVDGAGGKAGGDWSSLEAALRQAGGDVMRPLPRVEGPPSAGDAARVLAARSGLLDRCYAVALKRVPNLIGRGILSVSLGSAAEPAEVKISSSSFNDGEFEGCLADAVRHLQFPILVGETTLSYPVAYAE